VLFLLSVWLHLWQPFPAAAEIPQDQQFGNPAYLVNYMEWNQENNRFRELGSETRAYLDLVKILYDWDNKRPWDDAYFPEANRRLNAFRSTVCSQLPFLRACKLDISLTDSADIIKLQRLLASSSGMELLEAYLNLEISPWPLPGRAPIFSLLGGKLSGTDSFSPAFWNINPRKIPVRKIQYAFLPDAGNYRAGFDSKDVPAQYSATSSGLMLNDWQISLRAIDMASAWKHAVEANRRHKATNAITDASQLQFQTLFDEQAAEFAKLYLDLRAKVEALPAVRERFEKERAAGDYPEEVYQHLAYKHLEELALVQGGYFVLAADQRKSLSARQQALESLLTLQRYAKNPKFFALELNTLQEPFSSHAYLLDEAIDVPMAMTYVMENLKALLGMDEYAGLESFPKLGRGLMDPELLDSSYLKETAPEVLTELNGRDFAGLEATEQMRILKLYLQPVPGKVRPSALFRMGTLFLGNASAEELRTLADLIHKVRYEGSHL
jgi:hypothetical protein